MDDADVAGNSYLSLVVGACEWARQLAAGGGVVIWAQFDGYNYHLQVNHTQVWRRGAAALRAAVDRPECAGVKVSYEFKPTVGCCKLKA